MRFQATCCLVFKVFERKYVVNDLCDLLKVLREIKLSCELWSWELHLRKSNAYLREIILELTSWKYFSFSLQVGSSFLKPA